MKKTLAALLMTSVLLLSGCSADDPLAQQYRDGDNKQYIAGDGTVTEFQTPSARKHAGVWAGVTESGDQITDQHLVGQVVVLNFWYAGCAPCRAEAPDLQKIKEAYASKGVQVLGVNVRDDSATALSFARSIKIDYPSVMDASDGSVLLAYTGIVTPNAVPTTIVQDASGGVSARIIGRFDPAILRALIDTALEGK